MGRARRGSDDRARSWYLKAVRVLPSVKAALRGFSDTERRALWLGWAMAALIAGFICFFNALTRMHDFPKDGVLQPIILEGSSYPPLLLVLPLPGIAYLWGLRRRLSLLSLVQLHAATAALYFVIHVGGFTALRAMLFPLLLHCSYNVAGGIHDAPYELSKDLPAYLVSILMFRLLLGWLIPAEPAASVFDIRDGARLVRAPLGEILAVRSAGNYVEFVLADGRRPLMRTPLAAIETELAGRGFVRTHRSWLVNGARVTGLRPEGSGDYAVEIGQVEAPLSRRFPGALAALRG
jgi:hypothetical protein